MFEAAWLTPSNEKTEELAEKSKREAVRVQLSSAFIKNLPFINIIYFILKNIVLKYH